MSTPNSSDWELINAYADNELPPEDRVAVEQRLARDAVLTNSLSEIKRLKSNLARLRPAVAHRIQVPRCRVDQLIRAIRLPAAAAALVAAITLGVLHLSQQSSAGDWRDVATRLHTELSANAYVISPITPVAEISTGGMGDLSALDLSVARLTLVDVRSEKVGEASLVAMHYRGRNGCSLTIAVTEGGESLPRSPVGGTLEAQWSVGSKQYLLVATGMDRARFEAIAAYARAESLRRSGGAPLRVAVRSATEQAQPCA
jgi:anti-sigma factor RsiW